MLYLFADEHSGALSRGSRLLGLAPRWFLYSNERKRREKGERWRDKRKKVVGGEEGR